ncbi:MAG: hypothetical protein ACTHJT_12120 [Cytophaga sp.]|uniref:hypothetical protein n=1 Tax=Cytophaga sp. TaxID=29535 RepID=UPI003F812BF0
MSDEMQASVRHGECKSGSANDLIAVGGWSKRPTTAKNFLTQFEMRPLDYKSRRA